MRQSYFLAVWLRGNALVLVNEVVLRRSRLVPGGGNCLRVGKPTRCRTSLPDQLSLAIPPWVGALSTSKSFGQTGKPASQINSALSSSLQGPAWVGAVSLTMKVDWKPATLTRRHLQRHCRHVPRVRRHLIHA